MEHSLSALAERIPEHHPRVEFVWNMWPITMVLPLPVIIILNFIFFPLMFFTWWIPVVWNLVTIPLQIFVGTILGAVQVVLTILFFLVTAPFWIVLTVLVSVAIAASIGIVGYQVYKTTQTK